MNPPHKPTGSGLSDETIALAVPLLEAGTPLRAIARALGVSRHAAGLLIDTYTGRTRTPRPKKPKPPKSEPPPWAPITLALQPREPEPPAPLAEPYEDLKRTRQALKVSLDRAIKSNDRQATASFSLALQRLEKTADPGELEPEKAEPRLSLIPDAALALIELIFTATSEGSERQILSSAERFKLAIYFEALEAIESALPTASPGEPISISFVAPDGGLVFRTANARAKHGTLQARIEGTRASWEVR